MDLCRVTRKLDDILKVIQVSRIIGPDYVIPEADSNSLAMAQWINSYIEITTWKTVTNDAEQAGKG